MDSIMRDAAIVDNCRESVASAPRKTGYRMLRVFVPERLVARVDRALKEHGMDVLETEYSNGGVHIEVEDAPHLAQTFVPSYLRAGTMHDDDDVFGH